MRDNRHDETRGLTESAERTANGDRAERPKTSETGSGEFSPMHARSKASAVCFYNLGLRRVMRGLIARSVAALGYRVSGNHVFSAGDFAAIERGGWRAAVGERPAGHPARVVRAAQLLARTY